VWRGGGWGCVCACDDEDRVAALNESLSDGVLMELNSTETGVEEVRDEGDAVAMTGRVRGGGGRGGGGHPLTPVGEMRGEEVDDVHMIRPGRSPALSPSGSSPPKCVRLSSACSGYEVRVTSRSFSSCGDR
jgi:hypothetical protein